MFLLSLCSCVLATPPLFFKEYNALRDQWVREGRGFLLVYSIDSKQTFDEIQTFRDRILLVNEDDQKVPMVLVGNKCDMEECRQVSIEEGRALADSFNIPFVECSALKVWVCGLYRLLTCFL